MRQPPRHYPARFQLVAAMNPFRCGRALDPGYACHRQPYARCVAQYTSRLSGPLFDRVDMHVEVPAVSAAEIWKATLQAPRLPLQPTIQWSRHNDDGSPK